MTYTKELTHLAIDLSLELHKRLKIKSAMIEKKMRDLVIEVIEEKSSITEYKKILNELNA